MHDPHNSHESQATVVGSNRWMCSELSALEIVSQTVWQRELESLNVKSDQDSKSGEKDSEENKEAPDEEEVERKLKEKQLGGPRHAYQLSFADFPIDPGLEKVLKKYKKACAEVGARAVVENAEVFGESTISVSNQGVGDDSFYALGLTIMVSG